jgi:hypothetical protein
MKPSCISFVILLNFAFCIWGSIALHANRGAMDLCQHIWSLCVTCVVLFGVVGTAALLICPRASCTDEMAEERQMVTILVLLVCPFLALVRGGKILYDIDADCEALYKDQYRTLWIYFTALVASAPVFLLLLVSAIARIRYNRRPHLEPLL